jgi:hypothetical protein
MNPNTRIQFRATEAVEELIAAIEGARIAGDYALVETQAPTAVLATLTSRASERGLELPELTVTRRTLEEAYLTLVGEAEQAEA